MRVKAGLLAVLAWLVILAVGCGRVAGPAGGSTPAAVADKGTAGGTPAKKADDHSGWWCEEHGVPEHVCGRCSKTYKAECKAKGDWCEEHRRPMSQCFIHHPEYEAKFIQMHVDKFGTKPPPRDRDPEEDAPKATKKE